jgi:hypothetical protein
MLYKAITRPSRPAAPARLMATLPVTTGAPPVEVEDAAVAEEEELEAAEEEELEGAEEEELEAAVEEKPDEVDAAVVWTAAEPVEPEPVEADSEPALA